MKTAQFSILMLLSLGTLAFNTYAQDYTQLNLPEGAIARLGKGRVREVLYSPDGAHFAVRTAIGIWIYDTSVYREVALLACHTDYVTSVAFSPDAKTLAGGSHHDDRVCLWDVETGEHKHALTGHEDRIEGIVFSPDSTTLASAGGWSDWKVWLWEVKTGEPKHTLAGHTGGVRSVAFSPDGRILASGSGDGTILLWKVTD